MWTEPKTNWVATDFFNNADYNRIKNNLEYLHENSQLIWGEYTIVDMGDDRSDYTTPWDVAVFNAFESNLDTINQHMINKDYGIKKTFYVNGLFIGASELNRIESATLEMKATIDGWYEAMATLPYRLGAKGAFK